MFCQVCFHFETIVRYFLAVNVQTHPVVNVAMHLDIVVFGQLQSTLGYLVQESHAFASSIHLPFYIIIAMWWKRNCPSSKLSQIFRFYRTNFEYSLKNGMQ